MAKQTEALTIGVKYGKRQTARTIRRIDQVDIVISEVGETTIGYQVERRGRMRTRYIGFVLI